MANRTAEQARLYRAGRKAIGTPVPSGGKKKAIDLFDAPFLAWDGEGYTLPDGSHIYTLLANSDGAFLDNPKGIPTAEAIAFLCDHGGSRGSSNDRRNNVIFGGSYDANMVLRDFERGDLVSLWKSPVARTFAIGKRSYRLRYRPRKEFYVARLVKSRPFVRDPMTSRLRANIETSISLWDVWGFFQSGFVDACQKNLTINEQARFKLEEIAAMKLRRASFDPSDRDRIRAYCFLELGALVALMEHVREQLRDAAIVVRRWDGAGAVSKALLRKFNVENHLEETSEGMRAIIARAYGGGRIEITSVGRHVGEVVDCDLQSAYPAAAQNLPSMKGGTWHRTGSLPSARDFSLSRLRFSFPIGLRWYPLPYRETNGSILFPARGRGWYWAPEVHAAIAFAKALGGTVLIERTMIFRPAATEKPFAWVPEIFMQRAEWKRTGRSGEKMLKLGLNGAYGATAQQVGKAPFFQLEWAGYITSSTRARLVEAGLRDPEAVLMFATDGIFTTRDLGLDYRFGLGEWERTDADEIVLVQAGVYWYRQGEKWAAHYRGFDRELLKHPAIVLDAWARGNSVVPIPTTRFVSMGSAVASASGYEAWRRWVTIDRKLDLSGSSEKRYYSRADAGRFNPVDRMVPLTVKEAIDPDKLSARYPVEAWGDIAPSPYDAEAVLADEMDEVNL